MNLKTILRKDDTQGRAFVDYIEGSEVDHDAAAAHAYKQATGEFHNAPLDSSLVFPSDAINWLELRVAQIMTEWGFDTGEDA